MFHADGLVVNDDVTILLASYDHLFFVYRIRVDDHTFVNLYNLCHTSTPFSMDSMSKIQESQWDIKSNRWEFYIRLASCHPNVHGSHRLFTTDPQLKLIYLADAPSMDHQGNRIGR